MSAHVLLNLLNKLRKRDKMRGFTSLINSILQEHKTFKIQLLKDSKVFTMTLLFQHVCLSDIS